MFDARKYWRTDWVLQLCFRVMGKEKLHQFNGTILACSVKRLVPKSILPVSQNTRINEDRMATY